MATSYCRRVCGLRENMTSLYFGKYNLPHHQTQNKFKAFKMAHKAFHDQTGSSFSLPSSSIFSSFVLFGLATMASLLGFEHATFVPTIDPSYLLCCHECSLDLCMDLPRALHLGLCSNVQCSNVCGQLSLTTLSDRLILVS